MGLLKEDSLFCQLVDVWRLCLGMSPKTTDPVVQIIDGNEQDVWPLGCVGERRVVCIGPHYSWKENDKDCKR